MRFLALGLVFSIGLISLAPNFQGAQLLKLPSLVDHYMEHQSGDESFVSFVSFLREHYFANNHQGKNEHHMPFKTLNIVGVIAFIFDKPFNAYIVLERGSPSKRSYPYAELNGSLKDFTGSVWNPPREI